MSTILILWLLSIDSDGAKKWPTQNSVQHTRLIDGCGSPPISVTYRPPLFASASLQQFCTFKGVTLHLCVCVEGIERFVHACLQHTNPRKRNPEVYQCIDSFVLFFDGKFGDARHVQEFTALHWFQNSAPNTPDCISVHVSRWMQLFLFSHLKQLGNNRRAVTRAGASLSNHSLWWQYWFISTMHGCLQIPVGLYFLFWTCKGRQIRWNCTTSGF